MDIKLESDLRLETIFISSNKDNVNILVELSKLKELDIVERQNINKFIYILNQTGTPSLTTLKNEFPDLYFDDVSKIPEDSLEDYINLFISHKKNLYVSKKLLEIASTVKNNGLDEVSITQLNNITKSDIVSIPYSSIENNIIEVYQNKVVNNDMSSCVNIIDKDIGGLQPGAITTILGFAGSFKTTWAVNIAHGSIIKGKNVLYLSLEVTKEHIYYDLLSRHSFSEKFKYHLEHIKLKHKELTDDEFNYMKDTIYPDLKSTKGKCYIIDETELEAYSFFALENKFREIEKLAIEETGHGIDLLVIDHAQLLKFDSSMKSIGNETNVVNTYVSFFRQCALNWVKSGNQIAVLILSQASREGWKDAVRHEGKYKLTALAEANELERASSLVLSTYSSDTLKQINEAKVQILKNRDGQAWSEPVEVFVDPKYYIFGDVQEGITPETSFGTSVEDIFNTSQDVVKSVIDINTLNLDLDL